MAALLAGGPWSSGLAGGQASTARSAAPPPPRPRLVVIIAVDQLRADQIDRFRPSFTSNGFKLFLDRGARFASARYEHAVTETCPGHAVILTGSYAMVNGIVANDWYDRKLGRAVYCAEDTAVALVGATGPGRSPRALLAETVGDVLKTQTAGRSRVVTVSAKDRSAIMLGGGQADAAYWIDGTAFVTSTYYRSALPAWVRRFNASGAFARRIGGRWDRVMPASGYTAMGRDDEPAERVVDGLGRTFPHPLGTLDALMHSPMLDEVVAEFAMHAVDAEELGRDTVPDILGISFSATDMVGHTFGPDSHEIMDDILRLDRTLARLFAFLDRKVGLAHVVIVLTADHGVAPMPELMTRGRAGVSPKRLDPGVVAAAVNRALTRSYGPAPAPGWIAYHGPPLVNLNQAALRAHRVTMEAAESVARAAIRSVPGVHDAVTGTELGRHGLPAQSGKPLADAVRSFFPGRGGDLYYFLEPYWLATTESTGTGHGSIWPYDQQVPLLWVGPGIVPSPRRGAATVADIAPTLSALLGLQAPRGAQGRVLTEILR
ncbi:MAG TPA: alkaline phosphatase family protein [Gemmatimonadales bacterium]|nr:alkaline phosphatase family protein [Gemmatimonadales bacterium]